MLITYFELVAALLPPRNYFRLSLLPFLKSSSILALATVLTWFIVWLNSWLAVVVHA
jgi:hypothetical protein